MASDISFGSPLPPDTILARMDERAHEWRESTLPPELLRAGIYRVRIRRAGHAFRLQARGGHRRPYVPVLVGHVLPDQASGSRVDAHFEAAGSTKFGFLFGVVVLSGLALQARDLTPVLLGLALLSAMVAADYVFGASERRGLEHILREVTGVAGVAVGSARPDGAKPPPNGPSSWRP